MTESGVTRKADRPARGKYHPFRAEAVELYARPLEPTIPVIIPYWRWRHVALALLLAAVAGLVWCL